MQQNFFLKAKERIFTGAMQDPNFILEISLREPCRKLIREARQGDQLDGDLFKQWQWNWREVNGLEELKSRVFGD